MPVTVHRPGEWDPEHCRLTYPDPVTHQAGTSLIVGQRESMDSRPSGELYVIGVNDRIVAVYAEGCWESAEVSP
jgi:hypothetical protein